jgi:hypothetical protein
METLTDSPCRCTVKQVFHDSAKKQPRIDLQNAAFFMNCEGIWLSSGSFASAHFQFDDRLCFIIYLRRMLMSAATASKRRPQLEVKGEFTCRSII